MNNVCRDLRNHLDFCFGGGGGGGSGLAVLGGVAGGVVGGIGLVPPAAGNEVGGAV